MKKRKLCFKGYLFRRRLCAYSVFVLKQTQFKSKNCIMSCLFGYFCNFIANTPDLSRLFSLVDLKQILTAFVLRAIIT